MKITSLSLSGKKCTIQFYGCNFRCRGCFALNKMNSYTKITPERLSAKVKEIGVEEVVLAGGEPTLYKNEILDFIELCDLKIILSTNGYFLDNAFIVEIEKAGLDEVHIDLKAYSLELHKWYTGESNQRVLNAIDLLNKSDLNFEVITVFIPGIIDKEEIERIAKFLSGIGDIKYRIIRYVPVGNLSRRPTEGEIKEAVSIAKKYLSNVTSSLEWRTHPLKSIHLYLG